MNARRRWLRVAGLVAGAVILLSACDAVGSPTPQIECVGLPPGRCPGAVREAQQLAVPGGPAIATIQIRAVNPPCTEQACQGETLVTFTDGTTSSSSWGWQGAGPPPTLDGPPPTRPPNGIIVPECRGLSLTKCAEFAIPAGHRALRPMPRSCGSRSRARNRPARTCWAWGPPSSPTRTAASRHRIGATRAAAGTPAREGRRSRSRLPPARWRRRPAHRSSDVRQPGSGTPVP